MRSTIRVANLSIELGWSDINNSKPPLTHLPLSLMMTQKQPICIVSPPRSHGRSRKIAHSPTTSSRHISNSNALLTAYDTHHHDPIQTRLTMTYGIPHRGLLVRKLPQKCKRSSTIFNQTLNAKTRNLRSIALGIVPGRHSVQTYFTVTTSLVYPRIT